VLFHAKTISRTGAVSHLEIEAGDATEAGARVSGQGLRVLSVAPARAFRVSKTGIARQGKFSLLTFSQELLALLDGGLGLIEALNAPTINGVSVTFSYRAR
jgi:general secretion pathway protein F